MAGMGLNDARIGLLNPATGTYRVLFPGARAWWLPSGHIVLYRTGRYLAIRFDAATSSVPASRFPYSRMRRSSIRQATGRSRLPSRRAGPPCTRGPPFPPSRLTWIDSTGHLAPLSFAARPFVSVKLSPDGRRVCDRQSRVGAAPYWSLRFPARHRGHAGHCRHALESGVAAHGRLSFTSMRKGDFDVYVKDVGGIAAEQPVLTGPDPGDGLAVDLRCPRA